jgi:predicted PurR-regulated permease PerM
MIEQSSTKGILTNIISNYRVKANQLNKASKNLLYLISICLLFGLLLFIFAGYITEQSNNAKLDNQISNLSSKVSQMSFLLGLPSGDKPYIFNLKDSTPNTQVKSRIAQETESLSKDLSEIRNVAGITYLNFLTTLSTRIGSVFILIFLIQLLIKLYRYNKRLANYYDARANALEIHMTDTTLPFEKIINLLSPDLYDIGSPKSPLESMVNLFKVANPNGK